MNLTEDEGREDGDAEENAGNVFFPDLTLGA